MSASSVSALDLRPTPLSADGVGTVRTAKRHAETRGAGSITRGDIHEERESDEWLMQRYCAGDQRAFQLLYRRHRGPLRRFVARLARNSDAADEIFQEIWAAVIRGRRSYRPTAKFSTYLFSIAHRRLQDRRRRYRRWLAIFSHSTPTTDPENAVDDKTPLPESCIHNRQLHQALQAAIDALPAPQREVFLLKAETDMSLEEIAAATGAKLEATKSRLRYAVARLREQLRGWK